MNYSSKSIFILIACLMISGFGFSQNRFLKNNTTERTKMLGSNTIYSTKTLTENLEDISSYSLFLDALSKTGLDENIQDEGLYSVFVIKNEGFTSYFSEEELENLMNNTEDLRKIIAYHIIPGSVDRNSIEKEAGKRGGRVAYRTLSDTNITFEVDDDAIYILDSDDCKNKITDFNFFYNNGMFHIVDSVSIP